MTDIACIVLPTYNEVDSIKDLIQRIYLTAESIKKFEIHVLVVDDNSPDGTGGAVKKLIPRYQTLHLLSGKKRGLGFAYKRGLSYCLNQLNADVIIQMDADFQHDPDLLIQLFANYISGSPVVVGSRFVSGGSTPYFSLFRKVLSKSGNLLIRKLCRLHDGPYDLTSGYRCINADLIRACNHESLPGRGYSFTTSILVELIRNGAMVKEIPITLHQRIHSTSKLTLYDLLEFLLTIVRISLKDDCKNTRK